VVEACSNNGTVFTGWVVVTKDADLTGTLADGELQVRVLFERDTSDTPSPVLYSLSIHTNEPPVCDSAIADLSLLWPPNHNFRDIAITGVTDPDGDPVTITVTGIFQDEPVEDLGDGNFEPDGLGVDTETAHVRAERQGGGNGRVYLISFVAEDDKGDTCAGTVTVCVPHDKSVGVCVNDAAGYDSTGEF
jgi:hypothetical protein